MSGFYKNQGSGVSHQMTDQHNRAKRASQGRDKAIPTKSGGSVTRDQRSPAGTQYQSTQRVRATKGTDGTKMEDGHMEEAMSDGGRSGPASGKSFNKKFATSEMSQAMRRRAKKPNWSDLGSG